MNTELRIGLFLTLLLPQVARAAPDPFIVISLASQTLRLQPSADARPRVFPIGVGRRTPDGESSPVGTWYTGPNPSDRELYLPARSEPAFHRGLPFIRLDIRQGRHRGKVRRPFGIHGPVSPTLIWGTVSAGCIRMRPHHIRELYRFAARHPGLAVKVIAGPDRFGPNKDEPELPGCEESTLGVRRLQRIRSDRPVHDRICGGVDHWYALELKGGDVLNVQLAHGGHLRVELFGIRAISAITGATSGFTYKVPQVKRNRGLRYLRVTAPGWARGLRLPYALTAARH